MVRLFVNDNVFYKTYTRTLLLIFLMYIHYTHHYRLILSSKIKLLQEIVVG